MKTLRMIGMALMAVLMGANFTSCDKDEDLTEDGIIVSGKRLAKMVETSEGSDAKEITSFDYDDRGRLIGVTETEEYNNNTNVYTYQYIWGDDVIKVIAEGRNWGYNSTFNLKNGLVQSEDYVGSWSESTYTYSYNSSKKLTKYRGNDWSLSYIWDGDKVVSMSEDDTNVSVTYKESCKKGYFPLLPMMMQMEEPLFMAHPEIAGMRTAQLPATEDIENLSITFAYEFDNNGYLSKMIVKYNSSTSTYTLTWE